MRKHYFIIAIIFALLLTSSQVFSQNMKGKFGFILSRGLALPQGGLGKGIAEGGSLIVDGGSAKRSSAYSGGFEFFLKNNFVIGGKIVYSPFDMKTDNLTNEFETAFITDLQNEKVDNYNLNMISDGTSKVYNLGLYFKYLFLENKIASPYVMFGAGMGNYKLSLDVSGLVDVWRGDNYYYDGSKTTDINRKFYWETGGGYLFKLSDTFGISAEIIYSSLMIKNTSTEIETNSEILDAPQKIEEKVSYNGSSINAFLNLNMYFGRPKPKK